MKRISGILILLSSISTTFGCKPRGSADDMNGTGTQATTGDYDSSRIDTLEILIQTLKNKLETNQKISDSEREVLEKQIKDAETEMARQKAEAEAKPISTTPAMTPTTPPAVPPTTPPASTPVATPKIEGPYTIYFMNDCFMPLSNELVDGSIFKAMPCNNSTVQQFNLEIRDGGFFRIIHKNSGKCLVLRGNTAGEGTPPTLIPCMALTDSSEQWRFLDAAADFSNFKLQSRLSNFCLKIGTDGTIFQGNCTNNFTVLMLKKSI